MKKFLLFAAVATMFAACTKDATKDLAPAKPTDTFYVSIGEEDSRVQLNEQMQTVWTEGDRVSVFNKTTGNRRYRFTGKTGDRTGELSYMNGGTTGSTISQVVAVYPYNSANKVASDGTISTVIPNKQTYGKDGFGDGGNLMVAWSNTEKLSFRNAVGWIRVALTGDKTIKTINLFGNSKEMIAGNVTVKRDMSIKLASDSTDVVRLECGDGVTLSQNKPTYFYFALLPQTFENGLSIIATDADGGCMYLKCDDNISVKRNRIIPITPKLYEKDDENVIAPYQIWYTTSDNKIITPSDYRGNILSNVYKDGKGVITFDYIQTTIGNNAFSGSTRLTSVTIPNSVTTIGNNAFYDCTGLTSITIPDSVTSIGEEAFYGCTGLKGVYISDIVAWCDIKFDYFDYCSSNPLCYAHNLYLNGELVTDLVIPDSVTSIGDKAFKGCTCLEGVYITDIAAWCNIEFDYSWSSNPLCYAHNLYLNGELVTDLVIPDIVTTIGWNAFYDCTGLTSITIPDSVTSIGDKAFYGCTCLEGVYITDIAAWCNIKFNGYSSNPLYYAHNLYLNGELVTDLVIPDGVTTIGGYAFYNCYGLTSVTIPDSVTTIGGSAFYGCTGLTSITIPDSVTSIGNYAFADCTGLTNINIPNSVTTICDWTFSNCMGLTSIIIPDSVTSIGGHAFYGCTGLTSITIPDSVTSIGEEAFYGCTCLEGVYITDIAAWCNIKFNGYSSSNPLYYVHNLYLNGELVKELTIPDGVTSISECVFVSCIGLTSVTIPNSVTSIGNGAFYGCSGLTRVYCKASIPPTLGYSAFFNVATDAKIYVPSESVSKYKSATNWSSYSSKITGIWYLTTKKQYNYEDI